MAASVAVKPYDTHSACRAIIFTNMSLTLTPTLKETGRLPGTSRLLNVDMRLLSRADSY